MFVTLRSFRLEEALDLDRVLPAIAKVIEISHRLCADIFDGRCRGGPAKKPTTRNH